MQHELTNHFSDFFTTFDKTACRWERARNTHCSFDTSITTTNQGLTLFYPLENRKEISSHNLTTAEPTTTTMEAPTTTTTELVVQDVSGSEIIIDTIKQFTSTTITANAPVTKTPAATTAEVTTTLAPTDQQIRSSTRNVFHILGKFPEGCLVPSVQIHSD